MALTKKPSKVLKAKKTAVKKPTTRKVATMKTATAKKAVEKQANGKMKKLKVSTLPIKDALKKSELYKQIAEATELTRKDVGMVFEALTNFAHRHLKKGAAGEFTVPGLIKCVVKRKPAVKARKGLNPFTGEEMMFQAKPARNVVKVRPLKSLKEMVE
jgi:nucleoid DNA-binding protein